MKRFIFCMMAVMALALANVGAAAAQAKGGKEAKGPKATTSIISGTVVSSTADSLVIKTKTGEMAFALDSGTVRPATLDTGASVKVSYRKEGERNVATNVSVAGKPSKKIK